MLFYDDDDNADNDDDGGGDGSVIGRSGQRTYHCDSVVLHCFLHADADDDIDDAGGTHDSETVTLHHGRKTLYAARLCQSLWLTHRQDK